VMIPVDLGNLFDPQPEKTVEAESEPAEAVSESAVTADAGSGARAEQLAAAVAEGVDSIVVLEDDDETRRMLVDSVGLPGCQVVDGTLGADIRELFAGRCVRLVIISAEDADDRELAVCIKVNAMRQDAPPPIMMCAQRWTRTAALKALKYGARDIVIMPCTEEELAAKVRKFCKF